MKLRSVFQQLAILAVTSSSLCQLLQADNLPLPPGEARTPETRRLTAEEAERALQRDWLFQAMGESLVQRSAEEIAWARQLAARMSAVTPTLDLTREVHELDELETRLATLRSQPPRPQKSDDPEALANWIWYPEGQPAQNAPAAARFFRRRITLPPGVESGVVRVAADDLCEVFVNGVCVGRHDTWARAGVLDIGEHLRAGENVLAIRAQNMPAPSLNPAGLIVKAVVTAVDQTPVLIVSDSAWRVSDQLYEGWERTEFDDANWPTAVVSAPLGGGPWGNTPGLQQVDILEDPFAFYANTDAAVKECYYAIRQVKRRILLSDPAVNFSQLLLIDQPLPQGPESRHEAIHRMGIMAMPGGRLLVVDGLHPGGDVHLLAPDRPGSFWRPDLSFDAQRVLFCFKPFDQQSFHLYEMNIDGTGLRQLTDSEYDDIDPIYLPDGHIVFTTTRGNSYVRCGPFIYSYILARCDADGDNVYLISYNGEPDFVPSLLDDGRVIYSRWEYTDKPLWRLQKLWTTNQDGTGTAHFWGNQSVWPDHLSEPRQIPGTHKVMFSGVGHHDWWSGSIGIVDPDRGRDYPHGLTKVTADLAWPEVAPPPVDIPEAEDYHAAGRFTGYKTPYPLSQELFLVSARGVGEKFRLYVMDVHGNRELLYEGVHNIWHAMPIQPRPVPLRQPDRVTWPGTGQDRRPNEPGVFYSADIYQGVPELPRGIVKYLRVFQQDYKTYSTWNKTYRHSGPAISIVQEEGVKRILSEVPVEADGSVYFQAPAGVALYFQLLDEQRRCLQTMRSFTGLMPGEQRGCVGCHEMHSTTPPARSGLALRRPPTPQSPPWWGTDSISYERFAQPVLDRYCVECHRGGAESAEPNLVLRPGHDVFKEPYLTLVGEAGWGNPLQGSRPGFGIARAIPVESAYGQNDPAALTTLPPLQYLSYNSRLIKLAGNGEHYGVQVPPADLHRLSAWVDACCPFMGEPEVRSQGDPDFPGIERLPIRPRVATAPVVIRP